MSRMAKTLVEVTTSDNRHFEKNDRLGCHVACYSLRAPEIWAPQHSDHIIIGCYSTSPSLKVNLEISHVDSRFARRVIDYLNNNYASGAQLHHRQVNFFAGKDALH